MFDIGFWELMLIAVMGLVILGPERLPVAIRTVRSWLSGVRKFSDSVKSELSEELRIHELHANLKKAEQADMSNLSPAVAESVNSLKEAAAMVNEPFKKADKEAKHAVVSPSLTSTEASTVLSNTNAPKVQSNVETSTISEQPEHK